MPIGSNLQEMENVVTKNASPGDPMPKLTTGGTPATYEDLGGPTPENYKVDDNSAKLNTPGKTLKQVKDVVNKNAGKADAMPSMKKEEEEKPEDQVVSEEPTTEEEVVAESEETTEEEVVAESEETTETEEVVAEEETTEEEVVEEEESFSVEADVNALLEGEELSEDFKAKATTIFEAAIKSKIGEIKEELKGEYEKSLAEEVSAMKEVLEDRTDAYLEYIAQEWMEENALAVEHGLKTEMTDSFLKGMKSLFEDHYVTIPEEKYDVINNMVDKLDEMENKLNEQINKNIALNKRLAESVSDVILADISEGLALSQKDKLASLAKNVEFDSEETYREKLGTLRESYFPSASAPRDHSETISEGTEAPQAAPSGLMESYLQTMDRVSKK